MIADAAPIQPEAMWWLDILLRAGLIGLMTWLFSLLVKETKLRRNVRTDLYGTPAEQGRKAQLGLVDIIHGTDGQAGLREMVEEQGECLHKTSTMVQKQGDQLDQIRELLLEHIRSSEAARRLEP